MPSSVTIDLGLNTTGIPTFLIDLFSQKYAGRNVLNRNELNSDLSGLFLNWTLLFMHFTIY